jgi:hypothetical protein
MPMIVEAVSSKDVNTKFGPKPTYSIKCNDGQWYRFGFKNPNVKAGDEVEFEFTSGKYGAEARFETLKIKPGAGGGAASAAAPAARGGYGRPEKVFPIPLLHGDRSIIRQNSVTNAVNLLVHTKLAAGVTDVDKFAALVVDVARRFEAYSAGDIERLAAEAPQE